MFRDFVKNLMEAGHTVSAASFTYGGRDNLKVDGLVSESKYDVDSYAR